MCTRLVPQALPPSVTLWSVATPPVAAGFGVLMSVAGVSQLHTPPPKQGSSLENTVALAALQRCTPSSVALQFSSASKVERENSRFKEEPSRKAIFPFSRGKNRISQGVENRGSLISMPLALRDLSWV